MADRVRAVLITPSGDLLAIKRIRPGHDPYWVLPGGGVEPRENLESALSRELAEEVAAAAEIHSLIHILERDGEKQYFFLARTLSWSGDPADRTGPEFADPTRGQYLPQAIPMTAQTLAAIGLKPDSIANFLLRHLRAGTDLFALPDLRTSLTIQG